MHQMAHNSHTNTRSLREIAQPLLTEIARERGRGGKLHIFVID